MLLLFMLLKLQSKRKMIVKKRSKWCKNWLLKREQYSHINLLNELRSEPNDWRNYLRMDEDTYVELLEMVTPLIKKKDTIMRKSITPHERLSATLRFLACCVLHNFLRKKSTQMYTPVDALDFENKETGIITQGLRTSDTDLIDLQRGRFTHIENDAKEVRNTYLEYFCNEGSVPWQKKMCNLE